MYLKRIELNGFKSFSSKKEIAIKNGITGVVGPNGSGKSNIADAMRWVLGEQSSKNLRGTSMQDVIFNGTQSRQRKGYCEVALIFDNADKKVDTDYSEICVRRKMYRSGESEYSINEGNCRLKDILELFRDTGIGKEGYSIIGQGRIDEILNSKAVQRRKVFEEAAGITKYRVRKEEAERNLQKTNENILRIDDIIAELELQIEPLERQMIEAKEYFILRDRLKQLEINLFLYNHERAEERAAKTVQQIGECEQETADLETQMRALAAKQGETRAELAALQEEIDEHSAKVNEMMQLQEKLKGERALLDEKEANLKAAVAEHTEKCESWESLIAQNTEKISQINERVNALNAVMDENFELMQKLREELSAMTEVADGQAENIGGLKQRAENARATLQTRQIDYNESSVKAEMHYKQRQEVQSRIDAHEQEHRALEEEAKVQGEQLKLLTSQNEDTRRSANELALSMQQAVTALSQAKEQRNIVSKKLDEERSRFAMLKEMRDAHEGYFDSVKLLMRRAADHPAIAQKITGVLAELVDVPKRFELPMEVILGNALQNIVTETDGDAKEIIAFLRKYELGRVTFLPSKSLKVKYLREDERALLSMDGVYGVASELIECDDSVRPAVDFLLARTVIVEDMEVAVALMRRAEYSFRTVTMQGDFIKPGGVITGGSIKQKGTGLLSRKRMAEELEAAIQQNAGELEKLREEAEQKQQLLEKRQGEHAELVQKLRAQEIEIAEAKQKFIAAEQRASEKRTEHAALTEQAGRSTDEYDGLVEAAKQAQADVEKLQAEYDELSETLRIAEQQMSDDMRRGAEKREALSSMELRQGELNGEKSMLLQEAEHLRRASTEAKEGINAADIACESAQAELKNIKRRKHELAEELDDVFTDVKNAGTLVQDKFELREKLNAEIAGFGERSDGLTEKKNLLIEQKYRLIAQKEKNELARENMQAKLWDSYGLTYANALEQKEEDFAYQSGTKELEDIKTKLRDMDSVNPNAIEDYARVRERYDNLVVQRADLFKAGEDLKVVIGELLSGMKASFKEKFSQINSGFKKVFSELFGGGIAELQLLDEEDIMECGIEIIAEPPGKKLQNISLLSGGEKALTAIALLFAMLQINPSPVCLLDEIDAPLDEANLVRLADYLTKLSAELQFIVITHRKPTMAICDTLYGIAMHEKGVSDIVSVSLEKAQ